MTLNATVITPSFILQVSDRRMSWNGKPTDDRANKAIVLSCADGVLSITFTGIGRYIQRTDLWLADRLLATGAPELTCDDVAEIVREEATAWFRTIVLAPEHKRHAFVLAGWRLHDNGRSAYTRYIANYQAQGSPFASSVASERFETVQQAAPTGRRGAVIFTGLHESVSRHERRRLSKNLEKSLSIDSAEKQVVQTIQRAADVQPWSNAIGKDCMSIAIANSGQVRSRFFTPNLPSKEYGPIIIWNIGMLNCIAADVEALAIPGIYEFGGAQVYIGDTGHRSPPRTAPAHGYESNVKMAFKMTEAIHKQGPPGDGGTIVSVRGISPRPEDNNRRLDQ